MNSKCKNKYKLAAMRTGKAYGAAEWHICSFLITYNLDRLRWRGQGYLDLPKKPYYIDYNNLEHDFFFGRCDPARVMASLFFRFLDHTQRRNTVGRTPLDEWSARRRDLYLTTHNTHNRQTSMPSVEFEPTISAGARPPTYALDRAATGTGLEHRITYAKWQTHCINT
jgi:hypothetical protein